MRFLALLVLVSALAIAGVAAYFSIIGMALLFVGSGVSIVVMGTALEVGKLITVTFLKQKWTDISIFLKSYLILATFFLMVITSIGIYGYLSAGYNATTIKVQNYEQLIENNLKKITELKLENDRLSKDPLNQKEIDQIEIDKNKFIEQQLQLIVQKETKLKELRLNVSADNKSTSDLGAARSSLDTEKTALDADINKELEQIKLYNSRLELLDQEVQAWLSQGAGGLFKKNGVEQARRVKLLQEKERALIDAQIKERQNHIDGLRNNYRSQLEQYNNRVAGIEKRLSSQTNFTEQTLKQLETEITNIQQGIEVYNKNTETRLNQQILLKQENINHNKVEQSKNEKSMQELLVVNNIQKENIVHTDVGTFKFVAKSLGLSLDKTVTYFIWIIMLVFDPLAVCLIVCFNYLIGDLASKKKETKPVIDVSIPEPMKSSEILTGKDKFKVKPPAPVESEIDRLNKMLEAQRAVRAAHGKK